MEARNNSREEKKAGMFPCLIKIKNSGYRNGGGLFFLHWILNRKR